MKESESSYVESIRALCAGDFSGTADRMTAAAALGSVQKVLAAEVHLKDTAISLAQEEKLDHLLAELHEVAEALVLCQESATAKDIPEASDIGEIPNWWFALSEMLQVCEREIEFVTSIGRGQRREGPARELCNVVVRVLRKHYQEAMTEAKNWIDMSDD